MTDNKFNIIILELRREYIAKGFIKVLPNTYILNDDKIIFERNYYLLKKYTKGTWITISKNYYFKLVYYRDNKHD